MPRRPRILLDEGIYHVYSRGNNRRNLFEDPQDFRVFLEVLREAKERYAVLLYHYCLMTNHFHLLAKVAKGDDLPRWMHRIKLAYTRSFKKRYDFVGHLFQGRFRSPVIEKESYYLQCGRYIERNPVSAGLVQKAEDYLYSSARFYVLGSRDPLLTPNPYYLGMGRDSDERQENYRKFLAIEEPYRAMVDEVLERI